MVFSLITLTAYISAGKVWPEQSGIVLDGDTRQPIEGAVVVARWIGTLSLLVDSQTTCYHVESATTDAQGRYRIPAWAKMPGKVGHNEVQYTAYKLGYVHTRTDRATGDQILRRDKRGVKERLEYMRRISSDGFCGPERNRRDQTLAFYESLYQEAISITSPSPNDQLYAKYIDGFEYDLDVVKYGWEFANKKRMEELERLEEANRPVLIIGPGEPEMMLVK